MYYVHVQYIYQLRREVTKQLCTIYIPAKERGYKTTMYNIQNNYTIYIPAKERGYKTTMYNIYTS